MNETDALALKMQRLQLAKNALYAACRFNSEGFNVDENNRAALVLISHWLIKERHTEIFDDGQGSMIPMEVRPGKGILLSGGVGTGKTALMRAVSYARVRGGGSGFAIANAIRIVKEYNQGGDDGGDGVILRYVNFPELCIDDLGAEDDGKHYGKITNVLADIIALRYEAGRPTHFTTNADPDALLSKYDPRTVSRINEMASIVPLAGVDRRATATKVNPGEPMLFMPEPPMPTEEEVAAQKEAADKIIAGIKAQLSVSKEKSMRVVSPEEAAAPKPVTGQKRDLEVFALQLIDLPDDRLDLRIKALTAQYGADSIAARPFIAMIEQEKERRKLTTKEDKSQPAA